MFKKVCLTMSLVLVVLGLTGCGGLKQIPLEGSEPQESTQNQEQVQESVSETETSEVVNIIIDGDTNKTDKENNDNKTEESSRSKLISKIITAYQENQVSYVASLDYEYKGYFNYNIDNISPTSFKNKLNLEFINTKTNIRRLKGNGSFTSTGGDIQYNEKFNIDRYADSGNVVYYQYIINEEDLAWGRTSVSDGSFPQIGVNKNSLRTALSEATLTETNSNYLFTITGPLKEAFNVIKIGDLGNIFVNSGLGDKNITYQIEISKQNYNLTKIIIRESFNYDIVNLAHTSVFNLTTDFVGGIQGIIYNQVLTGLDILISFDYNKNLHEHITEDMIYESFNGPISNRYEYKTNLTKYDFKDFYNNGTFVLAEFESPASASIYCAGYPTGLEAEFYDGSGNKKYLGNLKIRQISFLLDKFEISSLEELTPVKNDLTKIYKYTDDNITKYFVVINDKLGFEFYDKNNSNADSSNLGKILSHIEFKE